MAIDSDEGTVTIRDKRVCLFDFIRAVSSRGQTCKTILFKYFVLLLLYGILTFSCPPFYNSHDDERFAIRKVDTSMIAEQIKRQPPPS